MAQPKQDSRLMTLYEQFEAWSYGAVAALVLAILYVFVSNSKDAAYLQEFGWGVFRSVWFDAAIVLLFAAFVCIGMMVANNCERRCRNSKTTRSRPIPEGHVFKDGDWAEWTEFPGSSYKLEDLQEYGKGPFRLSHVSKESARPDGKGPLWDIRYFKPAAPPAKT